MQNSDKSSLVESTLLPQTQLTNQLEDGKPELATNSGYSDDENDRNVSGSVIKQVLAAVVAQLGTINTGMTFGFSAIALPQLQEQNSTIPIVEGSSEESWIGK